MTLRAGVDVGGTFTDVVMLDESTGRFVAAKVPTDYADPVSPIVAGLDVLRPAGAEVAALHHATTLATNAVIEGRLPVGVLVTTRGFRDVLDIGRIQRPEAGIYDFNVDNPQPLVARRYVIEADERVNARGEIIHALDEADLRAKLAALAGTPVATIAVSCLFSFVNPAHEQRIAAIAAEVLPGIPVSLSSVVSPEIREFERTSTVVLDALLKPLVSPYLLHLDARMRAAAVARTRIMMASGGLTSARFAAEKPVTIINSGPSAGVIASANLGRALGVADLVTIDMGGTSLDIGVIEGGRPALKYESTIEGYPVRMPLIDVAAVAAGGGSLAMIDHVGYIQVDRESAGSTPGPACYGRGGERPTITDADVVLGRLGVNLGGAFSKAGGFTLKRDLAEQAFARAICDPLAVDLSAAASSVLDIIQARMVKAIAANTMEKGIDIRGLPLLVYGGAGPTHGVELADALGMRRAIVPYLAGSLSAVGLALCPLRWDESRMVLRAAGEITPAALGALVVDLERTARARMREAGAIDAECDTRWLAHMRYAGQSYDLAIDLGEPWAGTVDAAVLGRLVTAFHDLHHRRYAYRSEAETVEIVQVRVSVAGRELPFPRPAAPEGAPRWTGTREVYFTRDRTFEHAAVWDRTSLAPGAMIDGPAVIEGEGSSALIPRGWTARTDELLNLDITRGAA